MALMAERARIALDYVEQGIEKVDPGTSVGAYGDRSVRCARDDGSTWVYVADPCHDSVGLALEEERLPQRIRIPPAKRRERVE